jgi:sulfite exporter TauE/SafE
MALVGTILVSSLLGSPHCAAMCGGFACFYAAEPGSRRHRLALVAYNGGRLASYVFLGVLAGSLGAGVNAAAWQAGVARPAAVAAGLLMVTWGTVTILRAMGASLPHLTPPVAARRLLSGVLQRMQDRPPATRAAALGLLTTLLPCGWLYVFVATAGGTGSAWRGGLVMAAFWLGTVPVMAGLGLAVQRLSGPLRQRLPVMTAAVLVVIGLLTAAGRLGMNPGASDMGARVHDHR